MFKSLSTQLTPDNEGALVAFMVYLFGVDWKTSLSGLLSFGVATFGTMTTLVAIIQPLVQNKWPLAVPIATAVLTILSGLGKAWVGIISKDSGTQAVKLPRVAEPVGMPSHETPDATLPTGAKIVKDK